MVLVIGVHPDDLAHRLAVPPGEQLGRRFGVVHIGGRDQHGQQQPHPVDHEMALPAVHVLGVVPAPLRAAGGGVDRLAIDARGGAAVVGLLGRADLAAEPVVDLVQGPVMPPLVEVPPDRALGREVVGEIAPLAAGAEEVEDGIDDIPQVGRAGPTAAGFGRDVRLDQSPLGVGQVAGKMEASQGITTTVSPRLFTLMDSL